MEVIGSFYSNLYKGDDLEHSDNLANYLLENPHMARISADNAQVCEGKVTMDECLKSLNSFESNKTSGNDELTAEFYKFSW